MLRQALSARDPWMRILGFGKVAAVAATQRSGLWTWAKQSMGALACSSPAQQENHDGDVLVHESPPAWTVFWWQPLRRGSSIPKIADRRK